jgi:hypothetical protein
LNPYARWMQDLPQVDTPFDGLDGRMISGPYGQAVFFHAAERVEVPPHAHGAQWGTVVAGVLHLTIDGDRPPTNPARPTTSRAVRNTRPSSKPEPAL